MVTRLRPAVPRPRRQSRTAAGDRHPRRSGSAPAHRPPAITATPTASRTRTPTQTPAAPTTSTRTPTNTCVRYADGYPDLHAAITATRTATMTVTGTPTCRRRPRAGGLPARSATTPPTERCGRIGLATGSTTRTTRPAAPGHYTFANLSRQRDPRAAQDRRLRQPDRDHRARRLVGTAMVSGTRSFDASQRLGRRRDRRRHHQRARRRRASCSGRSVR